MPRAKNAIAIKKVRLSVWQDGAVLMEALPKAGGEAICLAFPSQSIQSLQMALARLQKKMNEMPKRH